MTRSSRTDAFLHRIAEVDDFTAANLEAARTFRATEYGSDDLFHREITDESLDIWAKFRKGVVLTPPERTHIEAIILPNGLRPAFDIKNDSFPDLPEPWSGLNAHRGFLEQCIRGIGRLNVPGHPMLQYAGTAFVVGPDLLLTNRHVAELFCRTNAQSMSFVPGIAPAIDFKQEVGGVGSAEVTLVAPVLALSEWDAALLRVASLPAGVTPLVLSSAEPASLADSLATIVGYPAINPNSTPEELLQQLQIFRMIFDKKRLQPGRVLGPKKAESYGVMVDALGHDCSTLGGNSGSALIDVVGERVIGLHFGGEFKVANYAVPGAALASRQELRGHGVLFN